jgi:uncharacterized protein (DUF2062 family)
MDIKKSKQDLVRVMLVCAILALLVVAVIIYM